MYYYSQVNCKIIGEAKTDVKAVIDYIQDKRIAPFFQPEFKTPKMIDDRAISECIINEIDHFDPTNYIELLELSKEYPNVVFDFIEQTKENDCWCWRVYSGSLSKAPVKIRYTYGKFDLVKEFNQEIE